MPLPFVEAHELHLGPFTIHPFGVLVASGVLTGSFLAVRRAVRLGLSRAKIESFASYALISSFFLAHVLDVLMYRPRDALRDPLELLMIWKGISSYGGFVGCLVGTVAWKLVKREPIFPYGDQIAAIFPIGWMFGRAGCAVAHDHVGRLSPSPLAVAFPDCFVELRTGVCAAAGARFDLGLLELLLTIPIAIAVWWYARKPRRAGAITGLLCVLYAPMRFPLDALRATDVASPDARYAGLTPAQWLSFALFGAGVLLLVRARTQPIVGRLPSAAAVATATP